MENTYSEWLCNKNIRKYIQDNRWCFFIGSVILFLVYGSELYTISPRIDTEVFINQPDSCYNWLDIGRHGAIFSRYIFENMKFNPYYVTIIAFVACVIGMVAFGYMMNCMGNMKGSIATIFFLLFLVHPIFTEQFYFTLQIMPIMIGIALTPIVILITYYSLLNNKKVYQLISLLLMVWLFSTYQLFTILFGTGCIFGFILLFDKQLLERVSEKRINYISLIVKILGMTILALVLNKIVSNMLATDDSYITGMIKWKELPKKECILNILRHIKSTIMGESIFYTYTYIISIVIVIVTMFIKFKKSICKSKYIYMLMVLGLQVCPFLLTVVQGNIPSIRSQFVLPFIIACNIAYGLHEFYKIKKVKIVLVLIAVWCILLQAQSVERLLYTDVIRFEQDKQLGLQIKDRIEKVSGDSIKPIAFIGRKEATLNASCVRGEMIGVSIFDVDYQAEPHYWFSSARICNLLRTIGMNLDSVPTPEQMLEARKVAQNMPNWPAEGSIVDNGDTIIVRLSEDVWYGDDLFMGHIIERDYKDIHFNENNIKWCIDTVKIEEGILSVEGWMLKDQVDANESENIVYLIDETNTKLLEAQTIKKERMDLLTVFSKAYHHNYAGFMTKVNVSDIPGNINQYKIILGYKNKDDIEFVKTDRMIQD